MDANARSRPDADDFVPRNKSSAIWGTPDVLADVAAPLGRWADATDNPRGALVLRRRSAQAQSEIAKVRHSTLIEMRVAQERPLRSVASRDRYLFGALAPGHCRKAT